MTKKTTNATTTHFSKVNKLFRNNFIKISLVLITFDGYDLPLKFFFNILNSK